MKKRNVLILVLLLVVGFAAVSTTLILNGNTLIGVKEDDFDVIFTEALFNENKEDGSYLVYDKKKIVFQTDRLKNLGDKSRLDYKVKNNSTQYGANVTISCNNYGNEYVKVSGEFNGETMPLENPIEMEAQEIKNGYIETKLIKTYAGEDDAIKITCEIIANPTPKDDITKYQPILYKEDTLNGADPILAAGLVPVQINDNGTVTYADVEDKWYSYEDKEWANAVILNEGVTYKKGDTIPEEDIESYFVWIPRYKYKIFDEGNYTSTINSTPQTSFAKEIQIEFESKDVTPSTGSTKDSWLTHPAFTNFNVNGLWVGKFETGYKGATSTEEAQINQVDSSKVIIKPNTYSWRNSTVSNMFKTAYNYKRDLDSHMMKNTEWGAVAYLSHSKYGINTEVRINNNSSFLTGYSAVDGTNQSSSPGTSGTTSDLTLPYNTPTGYKASTTGNITGIYDMSGGSAEFVAGYNDGYGAIQSGFTASELVTYIKYLDKYRQNATKYVTYYNYRILGDATGEMGPFYSSLNWYNDRSNMLNPNNPWFFRGGFYGDGLLAGQFYFASCSGNTSNNIVRLVLTPQ